MSDDYARGYDDACAIYTRAALDMARVLADLAGKLNAERLRARRQALRLRWRHRRQEDRGERLDARARRVAAGLEPATKWTFDLPIAGPVRRLS